MTDALPAVKRHATTFLAQLRDSDQVTVLGFNESIFTLARRSTDRAARARAIARLAPWGGTALYDVIIHAFDLLGRQSGRRSLLVFSDGEDQTSRATMAAVLKPRGSLGCDRLHDRPGTRASGVERCSN